MPDITHMNLLWALPDHAVAISRLHSSTFDDGWDEAAVARMLSNPGSVALVASNGIPPEIRAFILAQVAADEAEILSIAVDPQWQRKGVAARLVDGVKRGAARTGARALFLEVAEGNTAALALYRKAGFVETGRRKNYYAQPDGSRVDAIVMRFPLVVDGGATT
ncbi:MAG: ribosomal protein S18-alanine N-acetyltransferase [Hyphomicrobiaceae bacterium]